MRRTQRDCLIAILNNSRISILVIGNGRWGSRVSKVLRECEDFQVSIGSARTSLQYLTPKYLEKFEFIWICTTNILQFAILEHLEKRVPRQKIVIEKPYYGDLNRFINLVSKIPNLKISQPWTSVNYGEILK